MCCRCSGSSESDQRNSSREKCRHTTRKPVAANGSFDLGAQVRGQSNSRLSKENDWLKAPYGNDARRALQGELAIGAEVSLRTKATDRYGRTVAEVMVGTTNINQSMVATGVAFVYWQYIEGCDRETYSRLENEARLKSLGIWAVPGGIQRPWDYRRGRKTGSGSNNSSGSAARSSQSGSRYRCKQIGSWAKAQELLRQGHSYLDGDGDGEACESLK